MSAELQSSEAPRVAARSGWRGWIAAAENGAVVAALGLMIAIPLAERVLRALFSTGIAASTEIVQHLALVLGMLGAGIAARERRLLSIESLAGFLGKRMAVYARVASGAMATTISTALAIGSWRFVATEREAGGVLAYGIPHWVVELAMPCGFAVIAVRLAWGAPGGVASRCIRIGLGAALGALAWWPPVAPEQLRWPALVLLLLATLLGAPIFVALGGAAAIFFWAEGLPTSIVAVSHYSLVTEPLVPALPLFTVAGYFLAESGASRRLIRVFDVLVGRFHGGPALVATLVCAFFTTFSGASGVTILAVGGLLMPVLLAARFSERAALGLLTGAGSLGLLFPPCLPLILYFIVANQASPGSMSLEQMFAGAALPGVLLVGLTAWWGTRCGPPRTGRRERIDGREAAAALWAAKWELLLPVVAIAALYRGWFGTPVAAAALTALYALCIETVVHRDLHPLRDLPRVMTECGLLVGGVLLILGVAFGFTNFLVDAQAPDAALDWVTAHVHSKWVFLLALNVFLLAVGCLMDIYSAIVVVVPILVPLGLAFGIDPIHLGVIFLANLELGYLTPPVGMNLFLSSYRFGKPVLAVARATLPILLVLLAGVLVITYVPALTTWLPRLLE